MFKLKKTLTNTIKRKIKSQSTFLLPNVKSTVLKLKLPKNWAGIKRFIYFRQTKLSRLAFLFGPKSKLVQNYQNSLLISIHTRLLSVYLIVEDKSGKISGADNFRAKTILEKLTLVRQLQNLKFFRPSGLRWIVFSWFRKSKTVLSLATTRDRITQVLLKLLLEPVTEVYADSTNFGFRLHRSSHQLIAAINAIFLNDIYPISKLHIWSFGVTGFFTNLAQGWLHLNLPLPNYLLKIIVVWVQRGLFDTRLCGGILLPIIINFMLDGFNLKLSRLRYFKYPTFKIWVFRYGSKFIIISTKKWVIETHVVKAITLFLDSRGLTVLNKGMNSMVMTLTEKNLTFLGYEWTYTGLAYKKSNRFQLRGQKQVLLRPDPLQLAFLRKKIRNIFHYQLHKSANDLINVVNYEVLKWCQYYCFPNLHDSRVDLERYLFQLCWNWVIRKHPRCGKQALARYYFLQKNYKFLGRMWVFRGFLTFHQGGKLNDQANFLYLPTIITRSTSIHQFKVPTKLLQLHAFHAQVKYYLLNTLTTVDYLEY